MQPEHWGRKSPTCRVKLSPQCTGHRILFRAPQWPLKLQPETAHFQVRRVRAVPSEAAAADSCSPRAPRLHKASLLLQTLPDTDTKKKVQDRAYLEYSVTGTGPSSDLAAAVSRLTWSHLGLLSLVPHVVGSQASFLLSQQLGAISRHTNALPVPN